MLRHRPHPETSRSASTDDRQGKVALDGAFEKVASFLTKYYLNSKNALPQEDVPAGRVDVVIDGVSRVDHQAVDKLHGLGPLTSQLAAHNNLIEDKFEWAFGQ